MMTMMIIMKEVTDCGGDRKNDGDGGDDDDGGDGAVDVHDRRSAGDVGDDS